MDDADFEWDEAKYFSNQKNMASVLKTRLEFWRSADAVDS